MCVCKDRPNIEKFKAAKWKKVCVCGGGGGGGNCI